MTAREAALQIDRERLRHVRVQRARAVRARARAIASGRISARRDIIAGSSGLLPVLPSPAVPPPALVFLVAHVRVPNDRRRMRTRPRRRRFRHPAQPMKRTSWCFQTPPVHKDSVLVGFSASQSPTFLGDVSGSCEFLVSGWFRQKNGKFHTFRTTLIQLQPTTPDLYWTTLYVVQSQAKPATLWRGSGTHLPVGAVLRTHARTLRARGRQQMRPDRRRVKMMARMMMARNPRAASPRSRSRWLRTASSTAKCDSHQRRRTAHAVEASAPEGGYAPLANLARSSLSRRVARVARVAEPRELRLGAGRSLDHASASRALCFAASRAIWKTRASCSISLFSRDDIPVQ